MIHIRPFDVADAAQVLALAADNRLEAEAHMPTLDVDVALYAQLEDAGALATVGAFDDGVMVGYAVAVLAPHLHYGGLCAQHVTLYIAPANRTPRLSLRLMDALADVCRGKGAKMMTWHAKPDSAFARLLAKRLPLEDLVYLQEL